MGFGTVFTTLTFLLVFSGMVVLVIATQQTLTASATEIQQQHYEAQQAARQRIAITNTTLQGPTVLAWTTRYQDEFAQGTYDNTTAQADRVVLDGATTGTYTSTIYDTGHTSNYTTLAWTALLPAGSTLSFQVRTADDIVTLESNPFIGPDGTDATTYTISGAALHASHQEQRYVQWRANLDTVGDTPELISATLGVERDTTHVLIEVENTGQTKLRFEETDAYIDGQRITRTPADRVIQTTLFLDERLWNPTQTITYITFNTGTVIIQNDHAQATTTT